MFVPVCHRRSLQLAVSRRRILALLGLALRSVSGKWLGETAAGAGARDIGPRSSGVSRLLCFVLFWFGLDHGWGWIYCCCRMAASDVCVIGLVLAQGVVCVWRSAPGVVGVCALVCTFVVAALRGLGALLVGLGRALRWDIVPLSGPETRGIDQVVFTPSLVCASPELGAIVRTGRPAGSQQLKNVEFW